MTKATRLSPSARRTLRVVGPFLILAGLGLTVWGFVEFTAFGASARSQVVGSRGGPTPAGIPLGAMGLFMGGGVVTIVGIVLTQLGFARAASQLVTSELAPAVETTAEAAGRGFARGSLSEGSVPSCSQCGAPGHGEARFCNQCGAPRAPA